MLSFLASLLLFWPAVADTTSDKPAMAWLRLTVEQYARPFDATWNTAEMHIAWTDLDADGEQDALVYLDGPAWCGSGGCTMLVLAAVDSVDVEELGVYTVLAEVSLVHAPVTVAEERTDGWRDLIVPVGDGTWRRLAFDGETYPFSPADGVPAAPPTAGQVVAFDGP